MKANERFQVTALLDAYRAGLFPMADPLTGKIGWFSPDPRATLPIAAPPGEPGGLTVARSLRAADRRAPFTFTVNAAFPAVIRACAAPRPSDPASWIDARIIAAYEALHRAGHAHSVEAWLSPPPGAPPGARAPLVGGLYGVHIGAAFFGESMFSRPDLGGTNASKLALLRLARHLHARGFQLLDTQFSNPHMEQFGIVELPKREYLRRLAGAVATPTTFGPPEPHFAPTPPTLPA
jgi:leucyl/phenylalanyl-tRNA--protein transferase